METLRFNSNDRFTLGIELELGTRRCSYVRTYQCYQSRIGAARRF